MKKPVLIIGILTLLTGCWDIREIDEMGFVLAISLDPQDDQEIKEHFEDESKKLETQMFKTTYQVVIPRVLSEGNPLEEKAFFNISTTGRTNFKSNRNIVSRRSRRLNYEHLKVLIINDQLVKDVFIENLIDYFIRDHEMRRDTLVFISNGNGEKILNQKLPLEIMPAISIKMIQENYRAHHGMLADLNIGELSKKVLEEKSYLIPHIVHKQGDFKIAGAAIMQWNKFKGWLGEEDIDGVNIIQSDTENSVVEASYKGKLFVYETSNLNTSIKYTQKDGVDHFHLLIKSEGSFVENWVDNIKLSEQETNEQLQKEVAKEIENKALKVIEKLQHQYYADALGFGNYVNRKTPKHWKQIKKEWEGEDGYFSKANFTVEAEVRIRDYMTKEEIDVN